MSHATMLEHVKAELDYVDAEALQSIQEIIDKAKRKSAAMPEPTVGSTSTLAKKTTAASQPLKFVGENLTLEEFERLSLEERAMVKWRLKEQNHAWLQEKFSALNAAWVVVVDGQMIASGRSLKNKPMTPQLLKICRQTGKFPFVFVNDKFIAIEEITSSWHETIQAGDYYPALPIAFHSAFGVVEMVGDLDTGASHTFADYDFLAAQNIIRSETVEDSERHLHLNRPFIYVDKLVRVELPSDLNKICTTRISCVRNWHASPFVEINPNRIALIGRDILLELKPQVLLDFDRRQTMMGTLVQPKQPRKRSAAQKKPTLHRRRRRRI